MDSSKLSTNRAVARWDGKNLIVSQGSSVIELTAEQAERLLDFIQLTKNPGSMFRHSKQDLGD